jgi:hypothetical protein
LRGVFLEAGCDPAYHWYVAQGRRGGLRELLLGALVEGLQCVFDAELPCVQFVLSREGLSLGEGRVGAGPVAEPIESRSLLEEKINQHAWRHLIAPILRGAPVPFEHCLIACGTLNAHKLNQGVQAHGCFRIGGRYERERDTRSVV